MPRPVLYRPGDTRVVVLTRELLTCIDEIDAEWVGRWNWRALRRKQVTQAFDAVRTTRRDGKWVTICLHREILSRKLGRELARGEECDHRDGDSLNNTRENLRLASHTENGQNLSKRSDNTSGYPGVSWHKRTGKWQARIRLNGAKNKHLGLFSTPEAARDAYEAAAAQARGEYKRDPSLY